MNRIKTRFYNVLKSEEDAIWDEFLLMLREDKNFALTKKKIDAIEKRFCATIKRQKRYLVSEEIELSDVPFQEGIEFAASFLSGEAAKLRSYEAISSIEVFLDVIFKRLLRDFEVGSFSDRAEFLSFISLINNLIYVAFEDLWASTTHAFKYQNTLLRNLIGDITSRKEQGDQKIAEELHNDFLQILSTFLLQIQELEFLHDQNRKETFQKRIENIKRTLNEQIDLYRQKLYGLHSLWFQKKSFYDNLIFLVERFKSETGIKVKLKFENIEDISDFFDHESSFNLFRIIQEALNNVKRHSKAKNLLIYIRKKPKSISIKVKDDGKSFAVKEILINLPYSDKFGIILMRERARLLDGLLKIVSKPGKGTTVAVTIPLPK